METFNVIGFDPGKNLGFSCIEVNINFNIVNMETRIYYLDSKIYSPYSMFNKLEYLYRIIINLLIEKNPLLVGMEQVFKHRFANAVIQLSQYTGTIEYAVRSFNPYLMFHTYPPKTVKKLIGATGEADKHKMLSTVSKIPEISKFIREDVTEHEVDAIAIAYITLMNFKKFPEALLLSNSTFNRSKI